MKNLCPQLVRQRLIIEGLYGVPRTKREVRLFLKQLSDEIGMTIVYGPKVLDVAGDRNPKHRGFECSVIWTESGAALYVWDAFHFFTLDVYTCKRMRVRNVVGIVKTFFAATQIVYKEV